jgi:predicted dehydrogenase
MAKIGIIGTGWGARVQVPAFREAGHEVTAIAGRDSERTRSIAHDLGLTPHANWRDLLSADVDLVTIVTPPSEHLEMATAALAAGKHVLSEKPTAMDAGEARQLFEAAAARPQQIALIDHELRFLPAWRDARDRIGEIGPIRYVEMRYSSPSRGDRNRAWNWWSDASHGGGVWGAIGSHLVDTIRYFAGEITTVQALMKTFVESRPFGDGTRQVTSDDFAAVHCELASGGVAVMSMSVVAGLDEPTTITIHGERGAMRLVDESLLVSHESRPFEWRSGGELAKRPGNSAGGAFGSGTYYLGVALRAAIDDGDAAALAPAATFGDGLAQQQVLDAARRSARTGRAEPLR